MPFTPPVAIDAAPTTIDPGPSVLLPPPIAIASGRP